MKLLLLVGLVASSFVPTHAFHASVKGDTFYCINMEADVYGTITYRTHDVSNATASLNWKVEDVTGVSGHCYVPDPKGTAENMTIKFNPIPSSPMTQEWYLDIKFVAQSNNDKAFEIDNITLTAVLPDTVNTSRYIVHYSLTNMNDRWAASGTNGYTCSSSKFDLTNSSTITFENMRVIAMARLLEPKFLNGQVFESCPADTKTSQIVPIIVGACLAGLVLVVLVAYLVGRARARRSGYSSV